MKNKYLFQLIYLIGYFILKISCLTLCPTAQWSINGTTIAGSRIGSSGSTLKKLNQPISIQIDQNQSIDVADSGNIRILRFSLKSTTGFLLINGTSGNDPNQFLSIDDMKIDNYGNIYILDADLARVTKWSNGWQNGIIVAGGDNPLNDDNDDYMDQPKGIFIEDNSSTIWIADTNNHRIVKWIDLSNGFIICGSYGSESNQFMYPSGLFIDTNSNETLYVADTANHRIQMWLNNANQGITIAGLTNYYGTRLDQLWYPSALILDTNNFNLFIVDTGNSRIIQWKIGENFGKIIAGMNDNGGTLSNELSTPSSIDFDLNGSLYVSDTDNNRIQMFNISCPTTTIPLTIINSTIANLLINGTTIAGSSIGFDGDDLSLLSMPTDLWINNDSSIYILDSSNYRIQLYPLNSLQGLTILQSSEGTDLNQFSSMDAFQIDSNGNIYILDSENARITKWIPGSLSGIVVAGNNGQGNGLNRLYNPYGFYVQSNSSIIWIADTLNCRIVQWTSSFNVTLIAGSTNCGSTNNQLYYPCGLFIDENNLNIFYIADTSNHRIQKWFINLKNATTIAGQTGISGNTNFQLFYPYSLILDQNQTMFIVDSGNSRILLWKLNENFGQIIAGTNTNGVLPSQLYNPQTIRFDLNQNLYIADTGNNRIQLFSRSNVLNNIESTTMNHLITSNQLISSQSILEENNTNEIIWQTTKSSLTTSKNNFISIQKNCSTKNYFFFHFHFLFLCLLNIFI